MKVRRILFLLTAFLGAALLGTVGLQIGDAVHRHLEAKRVVQSGETRALLAGAATALARERFAGYARLSGAAQGEAEDDVRKRVDRLLAASAEFCRTGHRAMRWRTGSQASERPPAGWRS